MSMKKGSKSDSSKSKSGKSAKSKKTKVSAQIYYHYYLPRAEVENILLKAGDFLVRETIMPDKRAAIILSVRGPKSPTDVDHFPIEFNVDDGTFYIDANVAKASIPELIEHHRKKGVAIQDYLLKTPIPRNKWEILDNQMKFEDKKLGQGNFATVHKGQFFFNNKWIPVAYKRLRTERFRSKYDRDKAKHQILREFQFGRLVFGHSRIMAVFGIYIGSEELAVVTEFCDGGGLDDFIKKQYSDKINVPIVAKLNFLYHAADGLSYMHHLKLIHRDVAARNFLLVKREQTNYLPLVKVADFGLTRLGPLYKMKDEHEIPFMISALECLADKNPYWTLKSDCWSFGVLIYDLFNDCQIEPYACEVIPLNLVNVREYLEKGERLLGNDSMPADCKKLMEQCFNVEPQKRPDMKEIRDRLIPMVRKVWTERKTT